MSVSVLIQSAQWSPRPQSLFISSVTAARLYGTSPDDARYSAGVELLALQAGLEPSDWKPMKTVGAGVREIRIREASGAFRVIYLATLPDRIPVFHAFQKKTQQTPQKDIDLAAKRLKTWKTEQ